MYYTAALLSDMQNIRHGFFTRTGGVSKDVYESLNCGRGSQDHSENILQNLQIIKNAVGFERGPFVAKQVHGSAVFIIDKKYAVNPEERPEADAIVTAEKNIGIGVLTADCVPVLLADNQNQVIGAAHAGRKGAISGIIKNVISEMKNLGAETENIRAAIGPAISEKNYAVNSEIQSEFLDHDSNNSVYFSKIDGKIYMNLKAYVHHTLISEGINQIDMLQHCTYEQEKEFFSYRRSFHQKHQDYGRQISVISLF